MRRSTLSRGDAGGFTLLEVMVALAIMASVVFTVIGAVNHHLSIVERDRQEIVAVLLARQKLAELEEVKDIPEKMEGTFAPEHPEYAWELTAAPTELESLRRRMSLAVSWDNKKRSVALVRYLAP